MVFWKEPGGSAAHFLVRASYVPEAEGGLMATVLSHASPDSKFRRFCTGRCSRAKPPFNFGGLVCGRAMLLWDSHLCLWQRHILEEILLVVAGTRIFQQLTAQSSIGWPHNLGFGPLKQNKCQCMLFLCYPKCQSSPTQPPPPQKKRIVIYVAVFVVFWGSVWALTLVFFEKNHKKQSDLSFDPLRHPKQNTWRPKQHFPQNHDIQAMLLCPRPALLGLQTRWSSCKFNCPALMESVVRDAKETLLSRQPAARLEVAKAFSHQLGMIVARFLREGCVESGWLPREKSWRGGFRAAVGAIFLNFFAVFRSRRKR